MKSKASIKKRVFEAFAELGFVPKRISNELYYFDTGVDIVKYLASDDDSLNFYMPYVLYSHDVSEQKMQEIIQDVNSKYKYVKAYTLGNCCCISIERKLYEWDFDHLEDIISDIIVSLNTVSEYISSKKDSNKKDEDDDDDDLSLENLI